jgi:ketosteroid isomerase-like protein
MTITTETELGQRWADAELQADVAALDDLLTDDFVAVGPLGFLLTKEQFLDRHRSGDLHYEAFEWTIDMQRQYGDTTVVIGTQVSTSTYQGNPVPFGNLRITQIVVRQEDQVRLAGLHMSQRVEPV